MSPPRVVYDGTQWVGRNGILIPAATPIDSFELGVTQPTVANTGPRIPDASLKSYGGSFTNVKAGDRIERLAITGRFYPPAVDDVILRDTLILLGDNPAGPSTGSKAAGDAVVRDWYAMRFTSTAQTSGKGVLAEFCEVRPSNPTVDSYGVSGANYDLFRCKIGMVVDGLSPAGLTTQPITSQWFAARGCYIYDVRGYASDPRQLDGSHSDGSQMQGWFSKVSPWSGVLGVVGSTIYGGRTSCLLVQQDRGTYGPDFQLSYNWLYGHPTQGATINASAGNRLDNLHVIGNRISQTSRAGNYRFLLQNPTYLLWRDDPAWRASHIYGNTVLETGAVVNPSNGG